MLLALFSPNSKKQVALPINVQIKFLKDQRIPFLPLFYPENLNKRKNQKKLRDRLILAHRSEADIYGLPYGLLSYLPSLNLKINYLADGQKYRLGSLPQILNNKFPGWQKSHLAIPITDDFMFHAARFLATEVKWLHLFFANEEILKKTSSIIYRESGLISSYSYSYPFDAEIILIPPGQNIKTETSSIKWQNWPDYLIDNNNGDIFPVHWGESMLLSSMGKEKLDLWQKQSLSQQVRRLFRYSLNYEFSPIEICHESKSSFISHMLSK